MEIALIGCGRIGFLLERDPLRNKPCTHYGGAVSAGLRISCAAETDKNRLSLFREAAGLSSDSCFSDYKELIAAKRPEAAVIALPTPLHAEAASEAIKGGARVIVLEKPIAYSLQSAKRLTDLCTAYGTRLIVNHERRFDGRYQKVKALIDKGAIGDIRTVQGRILTGNYRGNSSPYEGGGPLLHDGTHLIDIIRFFCGEIISAEGEIRRFGRAAGFEDRAAAWLKTTSGTDVFIEAGGGYKHFVFEVELFGTEGKILIGNGYEGLWKSKSSKFYTGFKDLDPVPFAYKKNNCFTELYREAGRALKNPDIQLRSSGHDGYKALEIIHGIYYSAANNKELIELPFDDKEIRKIRIEKIFGLSEKVK